MPVPVALLLIAVIALTVVAAVSIRSAFSAREAELAQSARADKLAALVAEREGLGVVQYLPNAEIKTGEYPSGYTYPCVEVLRMGERKKWKLTAAEVAEIEARAGKNLADWVK
jgi:hypothetical protein